MRPSGVAALSIDTQGQECIPILTVPLAEVRSCPQDALRRILRFLGISCTEEIATEWMRRISDEEKRQASVERSVAGSYNPQGLRQMTMKTYSTYAMRTPLSSHQLPVSAEMLLKAGCVTQTLQAHHRLLNDESLPPEGYLIALCCHAAMRWVQRYFTEAEAHTLAVTAVFPVLRDLNLHLLARAGVQQALIGALELPDTATNRTISLG